MRQLVVATTNAGKFREISASFRDLPYTLVSQAQIAPSLTVAKTGFTLSENALIKARAVAAATGHLALADDSGLMVDALDGRPGVYSARYGIDDADRIRKLLQEMQSIPEPERTARFVCAMALVTPEQDIGMVKGQVEGWITSAPLGRNGFGFDPVFFCPELGKTFGEATPEEKDRVSHRARALTQIKPLLLHTPK